jgi:four helix bundle protein
MVGETRGTEDRMCMAIDESGEEYAPDLDRFCIGEVLLYVFRRANCRNASVCADNHCTVFNHTKVRHFLAATEAGGTAACDDLGCPKENLVHADLVPRLSYGVEYKRANRRTGFSAAANIAEGSANRGTRAFGRYIGISNGSLADLSYAFRVVRVLENLSPQEYDEVFELREPAGKATWGLCRSTGRRSQY